jgi:hypothetical protein
LPLSLKCYLIYFNMKKITTTLLFILSCGLSYSQGNGHHGNSNTEHWDIFGNSIDAQDVFGTINNLPINFITNSIQRMTLDVNGNLKLNNLAGTGNRLLRTDANGNISALPAGGSGQFLLSDGTWANLPSGSTLFGSSGNNFFTTNTGNVGIGTTSPQYKLDVAGDARVTNNLYVGGGVVITNQVDATLKINTGDMIVNNDLSVAGKSTFNNAITSTQGFMFDPTNGFKYVPGGGGSADNFIFGRAGGGGSGPPPVNPCLVTGTDPGYNFMGHLHVWDVTNNLALNMGSDGVNSNIDASGSGTALLINYYCGKNVIMCAGANGGKVSVGNNFEAGFANQDLNITANINAVGGTKIAVGAFSQHTQPGGWNTKITVNLDGTKAIGVVNGATGAEKFTVYGDGNLTTGKNVQIGFNNPIIQDANTSLNINNQTMDGLKFTTGTPFSKVISIVNTSLPNPNPFAIYGNGAMNITTSLTGQKMFAIDNTAYSASAFEVLSNGLTTIRVNPSLSLDALVINDFSTSIPKANFKVKTNGTVYAREIFVQLNPFPDYVFAPDYKLMPLTDLQEFVKKNSHLPNVPTASEVADKGANLGEIQKANIEKTEEIYLYLFELNRKIESLEKENKELRNLVSKK